MLLVARRWDDGADIRMAHAFKMATLRRKGLNLVAFSYIEFGSV